MINTLIFLLSLTLVSASHFALISPSASKPAVAHASSTDGIRTVLAASYDDLAAWAVSVRACGDVECSVRLAAAPIAADDEMMTAVRMAMTQSGGQGQNAWQGQHAGLGHNGRGGTVSRRGGQSVFGGGGDGGKGVIGCVTAAAEKPRTVTGSFEERSGGTIPESAQYLCQCANTCRYWIIYGGMPNCN